MAGELQQPGAGNDPTQLRISDADRHQVAEILREAAGEGRLDIDELDQRLEATYAARTYADLVPITLDLPAHPHQLKKQNRQPSPHARQWRRSTHLHPRQHHCPCCPTTGYR